MADAFFTPEEVERALRGGALTSAGAPGTAIQRGPQGAPQGALGPFTDQEVLDVLRLQKQIEADPAFRAALSQAIDQRELLRFKDRPLLADDFLTSTLGKLGPAGLHDAAARARISEVDPNSSDEVSSMFRRFYPKGELKWVDIPMDHASAEAGSRVLMFRPDKKSSWSRFDEPGLSGHDLADLAGAMPQILGEIGGAAVTRGAPTLLRMGAGAIGAGLGEGAESELLQAQGVRAQEPASVTLARGADAAVQSFIAGVLFTGGAQIARAATGGGGIMPGPVTTGEAARGALAAEKALQTEAKQVGAAKIPPLTAAQLSESPVTQRIAMLAGTVSKRVSQTTERQLARVRELLSTRNRTPAMQSELADIRATATRQVQIWRDRATQALSGRSILPREGGVAAQDAIEAWRLNSQQLVSQLYDEAEAISPLFFNLGPLRQWRAGFDAQLQSGQIREVPASLRQTIAQVDRILQTATEQGRGDLFTTVINPATGQPTRAWEILDSARGNAFSSTLKSPLELRTPQDIVLARDLQNTLDGILDAPVASNVSDTARWNAAIDDARAAARKRFDDIRTFEGLAQARAFEFDPSGFAKSLMQPTRDELPRQVHKMLADMGMTPRWDAIKAGVHGELSHLLVTSPRSVTNWFDQWRDPAVRRLFMSPGEELSWRTAARDLDELSGLGWENIVSNSVNNTTAVLEMVAKGDNAGIRRLLAEPATSPLRRSIRAGMLDHLANLRTEHKGVGATFQAQIPDVDAIKATLRQWEASGADRLLTPEDKKFMTDVWKYASFGLGRADTGARIAGAEMAGGLVDPNRFLSSVLDWGRMLAYGWLLTSPAFRRMLIGFRPGSSETVDRYIPLVGQITHDLVQQAQEQPSGSRVR